jgi:hypothetical protein
MQRMNLKIKIVLFILLLAALGFFRENLFVSINSILYNKLYNDNFPTTWYLSFLYAFSYQTIYIAKWFITPFFAFIFWFTQKQFLWVLFHEKKLTRWLSILYLSLFLLAGIFFVAGWALGDINKGYTFSRLFMGLLQSPVACMILIPTAYLYKQTAE